MLFHKIEAHQGDFQICSYAKCCSRKKRQCREALYVVQNLEPNVVTHQHKITQANFEDLANLLKYVPPTYHTFFKELPYNSQESNKEEHPDISDTDTEAFLEGDPEESICD